MFAIYSNTIENAYRLSENLQLYWNDRGMYKSIALFENDVEFFEQMKNHPYEYVILQCISNPLKTIPQIRFIAPACKIAVVIDNKSQVDENEIAVACHQLEVEMVIRVVDLEQPLALLSKRLKIV